jgi:hypothetical protein
MKSDEIAITPRFKLALCSFLYRCELRELTVPPIINEWWKALTIEERENYYLD